MRLIFLGTSAGAPTTKRNVTSLAIRHASGEVWLVDCGEGTQHQLLRSSVKPGRLRRIFITHLHGDHCFGLPGLLASLGMHNAIRELDIVGPRGLRAFVDAVLGASATHLPYALSITELDTATDLGMLSDVQVTAVPIVHRVPCFGFALRGASRRGALDIERARSLGVPSGPLLGQLADGADVQLPDGRTIRAADVLGPPRPGPHVVVLGDTSDASSIIPAAQSCDVLVHEATYATALADKAQTYGHATAAVAGKLAAATHAKVLVLTHFSPRYDEIGAATGIADLVAEASAECAGTRVIAANDFFEIDAT